MRTIEETSHGGSNRIEPAGLAKRLKAFALDYLLILGYIVALLAIGFSFYLAIGPLDQVLPLFASPVALDAMAFLVLIVPVALYFALQESSPRQATWGKRQAGLRVVAAHGNRLTKKQALVRSFVKLLPWQIAHTSIYHIGGLAFAPVKPSPLVIAGFVLAYALAGLYAVSALISKKHRTPYDWAAGSYVVIAK